MGVDILEKWMINFEFIKANQLRGFAYLLASLIGVAFVGKLLIWGYLMSHGIYPYDFFASSTPLFSLYFIFGGLFFLTTVLMYGWLCIFFAKRCGKPLPIPRWGNWLLVVVSILGHLMLILTDLNLFIGNVYLETEQSALGQALYFRAPTGLLETFASLIFTFTMFGSAALIAASSWVGGIEDYIAARFLLMVVGVASLLSPGAGSSLVGFAMQGWGIGGGLKVSIEVRDRNVVGRLVLLGPDYVYIKEDSAKRRVGIWPRKDLTSLTIDRL